MIAEEKIVKLSEIKKYAKNNKVHTDKNIDQIAESIKRFGYLSRIGVDDNYEILYGEGRYLALLQLGWTEAPVHIIKHLTEAQKREFRILDNKLSDLSFYDESAIQAEIDWLLNQDYESYLDNILREEDVDSFIPLKELNDYVETSNANYVERMSDFQEYQKDEGNQDRQGARNQVNSYIDISVQKGDIVRFRTVTLIFDDLPSNIDGCYISNKHNLFDNTITICNGFTDEYSDYNKEFAVWHKGTVSTESNIVLNNCCSLVLFRGNRFLKRRYNNLITAIPDANTKNTPPVIFFEDMLNNFIDKKIKVYSDSSNEYTFTNLAIAGSNTGHYCYIYIDNEVSANLILKNIKSYLGIKQLEIYKNEEGYVL